MVSDDQDSGPAGRSDESFPSGNILPPIFGLLGIGVAAGLIWAMGISAAPPEEALSRCAAIADAHARLGCYDRLAVPQPPQKGALAPFHRREELQ
jgi:hypothetical protein